MIKVVLAVKDPVDREMLAVYAARMFGIEIVGVADTPRGVQDVVRKQTPHVVLLDMDYEELLDALWYIRDSGVKNVPYLIVIGRTSLGVEGADYVLALDQVDRDWRQDAVNTMLAFSDFAIWKWTESAREQDEGRKRLHSIELELQKMGIDDPEARCYLAEAIDMTMDESPPHIYYTLAKKYEKNGTSEAEVALCMERAIERLWRSPKSEELREQYRGRLSLYRQAPAITEFVTYYAEKLKGEYL